MASRFAKPKVKRPQCLAPRIPGTHGQGRAWSVPSEKTLTFSQIVSLFGGTREFWTSVIRLGRLKCHQFPGALNDQVRVVDVLAHAKPRLPWVRRRKKKLLRLPRSVAKGTLVSFQNLERAMRLGSTKSDLRDAFPTLSTRTLKAVADYVRRHPAAAKKKNLPSSQVRAPEQDDDDGVGFAEELEALLESEAELFRRLAQ